MDPDILELSVPSRFDSLDRVADLIAEAAQRIAISEDDEIDLVISVKEAMNNAILHGNGEDPSKRIHLCIETTNDRVTVKIRDKGEGFEPGALPDPTHSENLLRLSGRGILMMKSFMDSVEFDPGGPGLLVVMTKHFGHEPIRARKKSHLKKTWRSMGPNERWRDSPRTWHDKRCRPRVEPSGAEDIPVETEE